MKTWRLLSPVTCPGALNMAIDQAILMLHAERKSPPTLRFYQWNPPAISLGHFQKHHGLDLDVCRRLGVEIVRRPTGGRAVLHWGDLTYALIAGARDGMPARLDAAYQLICQGLLAGLRDLGIEAELGRDSSRAQQPEICFLRQAIGDIVHQGKKIVGNAQTWLSSSLMQHGSIIIDPQIDRLVQLWGSNHDSSERLRVKLEARLSSLKDILGDGIKVEVLSAAIQEGMSQVLGVSFEIGELSREESLLVNRMIAGDSGEKPAVLK